MPSAGSRKEVTKSVDGLFWGSVFRRTIEVADTLTPQQVATLLSSFSAARVRPPRVVLDRITMKAAAAPAAYPPAQTAALLTSVAKLRYKNDWLFNSFEKHVAKITYDFLPHQLSCVFHAYSALGYRPPLLFGAMRRRLLEISNRLNPHSLVLVTASCNGVGLADRSLFSVLAAESSRQIGSFTPSTLAQLTAAYAAVCVRNSFLVHVLLAEAQRRRLDFSPPDLCLILNAFSKFAVRSLACTSPSSAISPGGIASGVPEVTAPQPGVTGPPSGLPSPFRSFFTMAARLLCEQPKLRKQLDMKAACLAVSAFARLRWKEVELFEKIGERVGDIARTLRPRSIAALVFSYATVGHRYGPLLYHAPIHVDRFKDVYTFDEVCMVLRAFSLLDIRDERLLSSGLSRLSSGCVLPAVYKQTIRPRGVRRLSQLFGIQTGTKQTKKTTYPKAKATTW
eukprot:GHVT01061475.1.p1 GENE.GHVT01061475.1~~GHVT01061475.1.p1  ORF type:complete len:452 (+),score=35.52 GHVT01061475.1:1277-2632(+)